MTKWLLLFTLNIVSTPTELRDVSTGTVGGFRSEHACEAAARSKTFSVRLLIEHLYLDEHVLASMVDTAWHTHDATGEDPINAAKVSSQALDAAHLSPAP